MSSAPETPDVSEPETESGYRSRSQSRRARRKKQTQKGGNNNKKNAPPSMPSVPENQQAQAQSGAQAQQTDTNGNPQNAQASSQAVAQQQQQQQQTQQQTTQENTMQPFEWIGPDETSMDGPVTYAKAMRGEIPMREGNPNQRLKTAEKGGGDDAVMEQDGLKLRLELNLDIEIELKARIQGDLTLALL